MRGVVVPLEQGSPDWERWRFDGVGASDMASVLGISPFDNSEPEDLLREKVTRLRKPVTFAMRGGTRKEPIAAAAYLETVAVEAAGPVCVEHPEYPWARASLDLLCVGQGGEWVVEIKAPNKDRQIEAAAGFVPYYYQAQCQWQLFVTGLDRLVYLSYSELETLPESKRLVTVEVGRDDALIRRLLDRAAEFWMSVMEAREENEA